MMKRVFSIALALMLLLTCFVGVTVSADEASFTANLGYANADWTVQEWGTTVNTTVTGAGEYTLSFDGAATGAQVFVVDIVGAYEYFTANSLGLTALTVLVDGEEIAVDLSKVATGDPEEKGNFRIELYNEWGTTKENPPIDTETFGFTSNLTVTFTIGTVEPVVEGPVFDLFVAFGGDKAEAGDWAYGYYGADVEGMTPVNATIAAGQTATVSITLDSAALTTYFFAPCLVADDVTWIGDIDFTVTCKINGEEVDIDLNADSQGRTWWTEGTGDYSASQCIRLAGSYNEWGTRFVSLPEDGIVSIEYTITINSITEASANPNATESTEEYFLFIGYGGDKAAENDWGWNYSGEDAEGITAVTATVKSGDTATISLTFDTPTVNSWWFCPVLTGTGAGDQICAVDMDIVCKIDGVEVPVDMTVNDGLTFWSEGTGNYVKEDCVRLAGGYNEWAPNAHYVAEPGAFTTIEYTITFNSIMVAEPEEPVIVEIDKNGTYNAYLMLQTPNWTFRNAHDDAFYGMEGSSWEALGLTWGQYLVHQDHPGETWGTVTDAVIAGNGTYSVKITDFGTIFADDFAAAGQDYFNIIAISTDLPAGANVTITNVTLIIDGQERHTYAEAYINEESTGTLQILIQNIWNADVKEISYYPAPTESLEIQFTIEGFDYDQEGTPNENPNENPNETPEETPVEEPVEKKNNTMTFIIIAGSAVIVAVVVLVVAMTVVKKSHRKQS